MKIISELKWIILIYLLFLLGYKSYQQWQEWMEPVSQQQEFVEFQVKKGSSFRQIAKELEKKGVIRSKDAFWLLAWYRQELSSIKAGPYRLDRSMPPDKILDILVQGKILQIIITIPEGYNRYQIGRVLQRAELMKEDEFLAATEDKSLLSKLGIKGESAEGYLFPETYMVPKGITAVESVETFVDQFWKVWRGNNFDRRAEELKKDVHFLVTLASIVEMEAVLPEEKPIIASVFWNRLRKGMRLQADPTVKYGLLEEKRIHRKRLTKKDLRTPTSYNTYLNYGLPRGPISNPGMQSLKATLYPAKTDYLYFVAKGRGKHKFSKTLKEHNRAVRRYILKR